MFAPQTYVCDMCGKLHADKTNILEIHLGKVLQHGCVETPFSNKIYHLCNKNDKCVKRFAMTLNQKEIR